MGSRKHQYLCVEEEGSAKQAEQGGSVSCRATSREETKGGETFKRK